MQAIPSNTTRQRLVIGLGLGGLLPFIALGSGLWLWPAGQYLQASLLTAYALSITCFLCGSWWGISLLQRARGPLVLGNSLVVLAVLGHALLSAPAFALLAVALLVTTWLYEGWHPVFGRQPRYYRRLRGLLTLVASLALLLALPVLGR